MGVARRMKKIFLFIGLVLLGIFVFTFKFPDLTKVYLVNPPDTEVINNIYSVNLTNITHNLLGGLQGGASNEFYHLNATEYASYTPSVWNSHTSSTSNPHQVTKAQVGLGNVENTALSTWTGSTNLNTLGILSSLAVNGSSSNTQPTLKITQAGASYGLSVNIINNAYMAASFQGKSGDVTILGNPKLNTGLGTEDNIFYSGNADAYGIARFHKSGGSGNVMTVYNDGTGNGLYIDQNGDAIALNIDSESASTNAITVAAKYGIQVTQDISGGRGIYIYRNMNEGGNNPLLDICDDHTAVTQPSTRIVYDGDAGATSGALYIATTNSNNDNAIYHSSGAKLTNAGVWTNAPSYSWMKDRINTPNVLDKFRNLDVGAWKWKNQTICKDSYKTDVNGTMVDNVVCINNLESDKTIHYGAYLDDMAKEFDLDDTGVNTQDWVGINQIAIKEIIVKLDEMEKKLTAICRAHPEIAECRG